MKYLVLKFLVNAARVLNFSELFKGCYSTKTLIFSKIALMCCYSELMPNDSPHV